MLFAARGNMERWLSPEGKPLTLGDLFVSGAGAGLAGSFVACPTELAKCRLQAQSKFCGGGGRCGGGGGVGGPVHGTDRRLQACAARSGGAGAVQGDGGDADSGVYELVASSCF